MAQLLGNVAVGSIVKLKENGIAWEFYVSKHDYESSLNGSGRTLVVRKDTYDNRVWDNDNVNAYASSAWMLGSSGGVGSNHCNNLNGYRPAFTLPSNMLVDDSNNIVPIPTISSITAPSLVMQGQSIPLSWTPVSVSGFDVTYQLQRNADNGGWTIIYTGANTSYTDTAGTWTQVQYQVAPVVSGAVGSYTQSSIIPVSDSAALVISGQDGNLGTITSNIPYTVSSNTGNPISLIRTINGVQVVTLTVDSGFAYSIPVADLPTGTGTIQITASVENASQEIQTQIRMWTYYKTPINIPSTGGIAQLTQNGQNIWPVTVPDAVQAPVYLGGNLNAALLQLGQAVLRKNDGSITDVFGYDVPIAQYEFGSYVGTGQSVVSLTFNFVPKIVFIQTSSNFTGHYSETIPLILINGCSIASTDPNADSGNTYHTYSLTWNNNQVSFNAIFPNTTTYNTSNVNYTYLVIG